MTKPLHGAMFDNFLSADYASTSGSPINDGCSVALACRCEQIT